MEKYSQAEFKSQSQRHLCQYERHKSYHTWMALSIIIRCLSHFLLFYLNEEGSIESNVSEMECFREELKGSFLQSHWCIYSWTFFFSYLLFFFLFNCFFFLLPGKNPQNGLWFARRHYVYQSGVNCSQEHCSNAVTCFFLFDFNFFSFLLVVCVLWWVSSYWVKDNWILDWIKCVVFLRKANTDTHYCTW